MTHWVNTSSGKTTDASISGGRSVRGRLGNAPSSAPVSPTQSTVDLSPDVRGSHLCVVTVCIGAAAAGFEHVTVPLLRSYARRCGADFRMISDLGPNGKYQHPKYAVMAIGDLYREFGYDRVLYVDADALVRPTAPNAFDVFPRGRFYARNEMVNWQTPQWERPYRERMNREVGTVVPFDGVHFNGGFQLSDREHADLYSMPPWDVTAPDRLWLATRIVKNQPWFNHRRQVLGIPFGDVGFRWNALFGEDRRNGAGALDSSYVWHFGTQGADKARRASGFLSKYWMDPRRVCLITVCVGPEAREVGKTSIPAQSDYALRCGYDFKVYSQTGNNVTPLWTRFDALSLLAEYDLVVYLDNDVLPKRNAPPITWFIPEGDDWDFYAFNSCELPYMPKRCASEVPAHCRVTGQEVPEGWTDDPARYPNSGVMVFNDTAAMRDWRPKQTDRGWADQNALMLSVLTGELVWRDLERAFNWGHMNRPENLRRTLTDPGVYFAHFNGVSYAGGRARLMRDWWSRHVADAPNFDFERETDSDES